MRGFRVNGPFDRPHLRQNAESAQQAVADLENRLWVGVNQMADEYRDVVVVDPVTGNVAVDTDTLFVDVVNDRVGINDATPSYDLDVAGDVNVQAGGGYRLNGRWLSEVPEWFTFGEINSNPKALAATITLVSVVAVFPDSGLADDFLYWSSFLPPSAAGRTLHFQTWWTVPSATTGDARLAINVHRLESGMAINAAGDDVLNTAATVSHAGSHTLHTWEASLAIDADATAGPISIRFNRDSSHAADTLTGLNVWLAGIAAWIGD